MARFRTAHPKAHAPAWWWSVREIILGANDGLVSTLAFVAGAAAALSQPNLILLAALAQVGAGAISMGLGAFVAARSRDELERREVATERTHLRDRAPEERGELERFLEDHGMPPDEARRFTASVAEREELFLALNAGLEFGITSKPESPLRAGLALSGSFVVGAMPPLLPFVFLHEPMLALGVALVASCLFLAVVGVWRARVRGWGRKRAMTEMLLIGTVATAFGYALGAVAEALLG